MGLGYLVPLLKIADFLKADSEVTTPELISYRTEYYEKMIKIILKNLHVDLNKLNFVKGSEFQKSENMWWICIN